MDFLLKYLTNITLFTAIFAFIIVSCIDITKKNEIVLELLLLKVLAASTIPTGIALLCCAFKPALLQKLVGFELHIAVAGMALLFISIKTLITTKG